MTIYKGPKAVQLTPELREYLTGGKFYLVDESNDLQAIYTDINRLEKGTINREAQLHESHPQQTLTRFSLYPYLIALGLCCLFSALMLELTFLREVP